MITLSTPMSDAVASVSTLPGYLVEIQFPALTVRWSSVNTLTYNGYVWEYQDMNVAGLSTNLAASSTGQLILGVDSEAPETIAAFVLNSTLYGFSNRSIKVWFFDQALVSTGTLSEAILVFDGIGESSSLSPLSATINLTNPGVSTNYLPRKRITSYNGFNHLSPKGTRITWGTEIFVLE